MRSVAIARLSVVSPFALIAWAALAIVLTASPIASAAEDGGAVTTNKGDTAAEVARLEGELDATVASLSTDCATACKALASIQRATERICALAPGPRCEAARAKADDATQRVRATCPDCLDAHDRRLDATETPRAVPASAVESAAPERGGCRSCATSGASSSGVDVGWLALAALVVARLRRFRRDGSGVRRK